MVCLADVVAISPKVISDTHCMLIGVKMIAQCAWQQAVLCGSSDRVINLPSLSVYVTSS